MRIKTLLLFALLSTPTWATWSGLHYNSNNACASGSATCVVTVTTTAAPHPLIAVIWAPSATPITISGVAGSNASGNWVCAGCATPLSCSVTDGARNLDHAYTLAGPGGNGSYTITLSSAPTATWHADIIEVSDDLMPAFGDCKAASLTSGNTHLAPSLSFSGKAHVVQTFYGPSLGIGSISGLYAIRDGTSLPIALADSANVTSYAAPAWTLSSGSETALVGAIALIEVGSVGINQVGYCSTGTGTSCTITMSVPAGHTIAVTAQNHTLSSLIDSSTGCSPGTPIDAFTHIGAADAGTNYITWWHSINVAGTATSICVTASGTYTGVTAYDLNLPSTASVDQTAATGASPSGFTCPSVSTTSPNEVLLTTEVTSGSGQSGNATVSSPWTTNGGFTNGGTAFLLVNTTGTYAATWARTNATYVACSTVTFKTGIASNVTKRRILL